MYKKLSIEQLLSLKTDFFSNLKKAFSREKYPTLKAYLKDLFKEGDDVYYFFRWQPTLRFSKLDADEILLVDEREKIELYANSDVINQLHNMCKNDKQITKQQKNSKSQSKLLEDAINAGEFQQINGKNYIVYDIETTYATKDLTQTKFLLGYAYIMKEGKGEYRYIWPDALPKFVDFMLSFDGYIIWFNSIWFDNPVSVYNTPGWTKEMIETIDAKSLDLYLFMLHLTKKRIWLNRLANALVWVQKTLESWAEWEVLMKKYEETGDEQYLKEFKKYCKNDVKMTLLVLIYLLKYQKVDMDNEEYEYSPEDFLQLAIPKDEVEKQEIADTDTGMFG